MPAASWDDSPDHDYDDHEYPGAESWDEDTTDTVPCPACGAEVYEDAVQCPVCGEYVTSDTRIWSGKPTWWIALGVLGIIAVATALILGF